MSAGRRAGDAVRENISRQKSTYNPGEELFRIGGIGMGQSCDLKQLDEKPNCAAQQELPA
jgi:hypothetical protein